jgi:hypothetical protein
MDVTYNYIVFSINDLRCNVKKAMNRLLCATGDYAITEGINNMEDGLSARECQKDVIYDFSLSFHSARVANNSRFTATMYIDVWVAFNLSCLAICD